LARVQRADARETIMKAKITHKDGRSVTVDAATIAVLRAGAGVKLDQIETAMLTVEIEGEEPLVLTLPRSMVEMMLESVGAAAPVEAAAPAGMEEPELAEQAEAQDAEDDEEKADSITAAVRREVQRAMAKRDAVDQRRARVDARAAEVSRHAAALKIDANDSRPWHVVAVDGIAKVSPERTSEARKLAKDAAAGDLVAEGRLRQLLADAASGALTGSTMAEGSKSSNSSKVDSRSPWERGIPNTEKN
jgi:hypothetical protein